MKILSCDMTVSSHKRVVTSLSCTVLCTLQNSYMFHCPNIFFFKVLTLRTVHEQLVRLLSTSERQQLRTSEAFAPFSGLNPLHHNPYTEPQWRAAVTQYEREMAPAEQKIAGKLRQQLSDLSAMKSHQVKLVCLIYMQ